MMKKQLLLTVLLALVGATGLSAQILFEQRYGINNDNLTQTGGAVLAPDGGLVLCGMEETSGADEFFIHRLDTSGNEAWHQTYPQLGAGVATGILAAAGGGYLVSGFALNPTNGSYDALLFQIDENGDLQWHITFGDVATDIGLAVCQLNNGHIVLLGGTMLPDNKPARFRAVFDPAGKLLSSESFPGSDDVNAIKSVSTADGGYAAVVVTGSFFSSVNIRIFKYDADLNEQWSWPLAAYNSQIGSTISGLFDLKATDQGFLLCVQANTGVYLLRIGDTSPFASWSKLLRKGYAYGAGVQPYPDGTIGVATHTAPFFYKKLSANGTTLDSVGSMLLPLASSIGAQYVFQADRGVYLFGNLSSSLLHAYTVDCVTVNGTPNAVWKQTYGALMPYEDETGNAITPTPDGGFVLAGTRQDSAGYDDLWIFKADAQGAVLWEKMFDIGSGPSDDAQVGSVKLDATGNIIVLAASNTSDPAYHLLKLSAGGDSLLDKTIATSGYAADFFRAYPLADGGFIACITLDDGQVQPSVVRIDDKGNVLWSQQYSGTRVNDLVALPDGQFVCAGTKTGKPWIFRIDAAGNLLWEQMYSFTPSGGLFSIALTADGHLAATGSAGDAGAATIKALALKAQTTGGELLWQKQFDKGDEAVWIGTTVLPTPSGGLCFMGAFLAPPADNDLLSALFRQRLSIVVLDSAGDLLEEQTFGNDATRPYGLHAGMTADGHVIFCATIGAGSSQQDAWVVKTAIKTVSTAEKSLTGDFSIYPNPAYGFTRLSCDSPYAGPLFLRVFDAGGRQVTQIRGTKEAGRWGINLPLSAWPSGVYRVQLIANGRSKVATLVVENR